MGSVAVVGAIVVCGVPLTPGVVAISGTAARVANEIVVVHRNDVVYNSLPILRNF